MSNIDYSALINGEEEETAVQPMMYTMSRMGGAVEGSWLWNNDLNLEGSDWKYLRDDSYKDEGYTTIDKKRAITLHEDQFNLNQEENSQYISFLMPRYYDGLDFATNTTIYIYYNRTRYVEGVPVLEGETVKPINVQYNESQIRFGWLVDGKVTSYPGAIDFEVLVEGMNKLGEAYLWKSQASRGQLKVFEGLSRGTPIEITDDWHKEIVNDFKKVVSEAGLNDYAKKQYVDNYKINLVYDSELCILTLYWGEKKIAEIDLPLESVITQGAYDSTNKEIILTLHNGSTVKFPVGDLVSGLASETWVTNSINTALEALNNYYTKGDVYNKFEVYTKEETDSLISDAIENAELDNYVLKTELATKLGTIPEEGTVSQYIDDTAASINDRFGNLGTHEEGEGEEITTVENTVEQFVKGVVGFDDNETRTIKTFVEDSVAAVDISDKLGFEEGDNRTVKAYVDDAVKAVDVTGQLGGYYTKEETEARLNIGTRIVNEEEVPHTVASYVDARLGNAQFSDYYTKEQTNAKITSELEPYASKSYVQQEVQKVNANKITYDIDYDSTIEEGANFIFYEIENEGLEGENKTVKQSYRISGGGGTGGGGTLKVYYVTTSPVNVVNGNEVILQYTFEGTDSAGDPIGQATASWKVGSRNVGSEEIFSSENGVLKVNSFNVTKYLNIGSQKVSLTVKDDSGNQTTKNWQVSVIDVRITSDFDDTIKRNANEPITFTFRPFGAVNKTVHIKLDGEEYTQTYDSSVSGITKSYDLPAKGHGSYLLEAYISAEINGEIKDSDKIYKDILWYDPNASIPVIGTIYQQFSVKQYNKFSIPITVYDPSTSIPTVKIYIDNVLDTTKTLTESNTFTYDFRSSVVDEHTITIECGDATKRLTANVTELGITINPVTANLAFDFNPSGLNNENNKEWSDRGIKMQVSPNFDWVNGGYHTDENGDQYFRVKAGTTATIEYKLFNNDAKQVGKEFKVVFKTDNIKTRNTSFLSCMSDGIGLDMRVEEANLYSSDSRLYSPYCEAEIIEFEFNINKTKYNEAQELESGRPLVLTYEDGVANRPMLYNYGTSFWQTNNPQNIVIGSPDCDVLIYRMKAYDAELTDEEILANFIADARNAEEMIDRYNRNQIYNKSNQLTPDDLSKACPDLRIITIEAPWFTNDKDDKVSDTTINMIYENGDPYLDNWGCTGAKHSGQGTSSNDYGYAGRNLDLIMEDCTFTLGDGTETDKITLTRTSVPTNYLNVKVNIASSENQNNAQFAERFNRFQPFKRLAKLKDSKVKDTMEFYDCVVFIKENDTVQDEAGNFVNHREFNDTNWHFYAIGNVGDSKKTDKTRVNDKNDVKECVIEIKDYNVALAEFPTGTEGICPEDQWKAGNKAYDDLYAPFVYEEKEDGTLKFKTFGNKSYEFRYEKKGITDDQRLANINAWREFYKFVVTSDDEKFKEDLKKYFVIDSALYFYLFTERYTMVDNRAKNSFWHYGKAYFTTEEAEALAEEGYQVENKYIDNDQAAFNGGYRWDLTFGYDFDTALGIDNTGKLVLTYGKEDIDQYAPEEGKTDYVFRAAPSTFFCRVRDLFKGQLETMFQDRESKGAWSSADLISQWDREQKKFPEELWRLDIQRKYIRTFEGKSQDNSIIPKDDNGPVGPVERFIRDMLNGRKKYQRRMFERNQEMYMATKYFGTTATNNKITFRFNNPTSYAIKPDFTLKITPYSDMYIGVKTGAVDPTNFRAVAGQQYTIPYELETADITNIYGASFIQAIDDLSAGYVGDNDFSYASRLQSLKLGNSVPAEVTDLVGIVSSVDSTPIGTYEYKFEHLATGIPTTYKNIYIKEVTSENTDLNKDDFELIEKDSYYFIALKKEKGNVLISANYSFVVKYDKYLNPYMTKLSVGNNKLLQYLDIRNVSGLEEAVDLTQCGNLTDLYAEGAGATSVLFANGGRLVNARLPKISGLSVKNLTDLKTFTIDGYENLQSLTIENCPLINSYEILDKAINLRTLRLININWPESYNIENCEVFDRALKMTGVSSTGVQTPQSVITGYAYVQEIRASQAENYAVAWGEQFDIDYPEVGYIPQYIASFVNDGVTVENQLVDSGKRAVDPVTRTENPVPIPTRESTVEYDYEFIGWDKEFSEMYGNVIYNATYRRTTRKYTITYSGLGVTRYEAEADYGSVVEYPYALPEPTVSNGRYRIFAGWKKSGYVNGPKVIEPNYDECSYTSDYYTGKSLDSLRPVELYMLSDQAQRGNAKLKDLGYVDGNDKYYFSLGNDLNYTDDIESVTVIEGETEFKASEEKVITTGETLFDEDKSFTLAVDFQFGGNNAQGATIIQCHNGSDGGFRVSYGTTGSGTSAKARVTLEWGEGNAITLLEKPNDGTTFSREILVLERRKGEKDLRVYFSQKNKDTLLEKRLSSEQLPPLHGSYLVIGGRRAALGATSAYANGRVHWCKLWYGAIGENTCKDLAAWPHEKLAMTTMSSGDGNPIEYGYGVDGVAKLTFLADYLLENPMSFNDKNSNEGGWGNNFINSYLNNRLYKGFAVQDRQIIKKANVKSNYWTDNYSAAAIKLGTFASYIFIPAFREVYTSNNMNTTLAQEAEATFSTFVLAEDRICQTTDMTNREYWLRTPDISSSSYVYYVTSSGGVDQYGSYNKSRYIRPMLVV